jgi:hypothetical protein
MVHGPVMPEVTARFYSYYDDILALAPIAYYTMSDMDTVSANALDETVGPSGIYVNAPTLQSTGLVVSDPDNKAVIVDGVDQFMDMGLSRNLSDRSLTTFIVSIFKGSGALISTRRASRSRGSLEINIIDDGRVQINVQNNDTSPYSVHFFSTGAFDITESNMLVVGLYGTEYRIYLNGILDSVHPANYSMKDDGNHSDLEYGRFVNYLYGGSSWFTGTLDDLAIFDVVLTDEQIADLYTSAFTANNAGT